MLNCREVSRLVSDNLERELPMMTRLRVRMHTLMCPPCNRYRKQIHFLHTAAKDLLGDLSVSVSGSFGLTDEARERIRQALSV